MRKTRISLILLNAGVVLFLTLTGFLIINAYKAEQRQFKFTRQYYLSTAFYEQGIDAKTVVPLSSYINSLLQNNSEIKKGDKPTIDSLLSVVTSDYKLVEEQFRKLLVRDQIDTAFNMAILVNRLNVHYRDSVFRLYDKEEDGRFFVVSGDIEKVDLSIPDNTFFYRFNDAGTTMQVAVYVNFIHPERFLFGEIIHQLVLVLVMLIIFLIIVGYTARTIRNQEKVDAMKTDFINNMTHELKTPLTTLAIAAKTIDEGNLKEIGSLITKQVSRLEKIVDRIMSVAFFENKKTLNKEWFELGVFLSHLLEETAYNNGLIKLMIKDEHKNKIIFADAFMLSTAIYNLLDNAIKYSGEKEVVLGVNISENRLKISVEDKGPGIAENHQPFLFKKFYRVQSGNLHNVKGTGLGLYHVKQIVEAHDGGVKLMSKLGVGTTVEMTIPVKIKNSNDTN